MEIWHRISFNTSQKEPLLGEIQGLEIQYQSVSLPGKGGALVSFDISESDPKWRIISDLVEPWNAVDVYETFFSHDEILNSEWVRLIPINPVGYPQPEKTWSRDHPNYDQYCRECGTHIQKSAFALRGQLRLKESEFATLYWAYALLCSHATCDELTASALSGFECWQVFEYRSDKASEMRQIFIPDIAKPGLVGGELLNPQQCPECKHVKYVPHMRGIMRLRSDSIPQNLDFVRTYEWFGTGRSAFREILVSRRVAKHILDRDSGGVRLKAIDLI
jgi:hypothetical protein